ncbi:MAG: S9 family peptidase, partial [Allomuricauda sp.]
MKTTLNFKQLCGSLLFLLTGLTTYSQQPPADTEKGEQSLPGKPELVSSNDEFISLASLDEGDYRYTVKDYFANPKAFTFRFSPDGKYLSYRESDENGKQHIYVKDITTGVSKRAIEEKDELVRGYGWLNNGRLYYSMDKGGDENYHIYAVDLDGSNMKDLTPFDGVRAQFTELLREDKNHIIVSMNKNNPQVFEPYKVNLNSGELTQLFSNDDPANPIFGYNFDKDGNLKGYVRIRDGVEQDVYYEDGNGGYKLLKSLNWKDNFNILDFNYATENPHDAYVLSNLESDKAEIVLYDLKEDKVIEKVFVNDHYDVQGLGLSRTRNYTIDYFEYEGEKAIVVPVSEPFKKLDKKVSKELPGKMYDVLDATEDENLLMVYVDS